MYHLLAKSEEEFNPMEKPKPQMDVERRDRKYANRRIHRIFNKNLLLFLNGEFQITPLSLMKLKTIINLSRITIYHIKVV